MEKERLFLQLTGQSLDLYNVAQDKWTNIYLQELYEFYTECAIDMIKRYLKQEDVAMHEKPIVMLTAHLYNTQQINISGVTNGNVKALSSGGRSVTFMSMEEIFAITIPDYIKVMLPKPTVVKVW